MLQILLAETSRNQRRTTENGLLTLNLASDPLLNDDLQYTVHGRATVQSQTFHGITVMYIYIYEIIWVYIRNYSRWEWMISNIECSRSLVILIVIVTVDILIYYSRLSNGCLVLTVVLDFDRKVKVKQDACEIIFEIRPRKLWRCVPLSKVIVNCAWYTCFTG